MPLDGSGRFSEETQHQQWHCFQLRQAGAVLSLPEGSEWSSPWTPSESHGAPTFPLHLKHFFVSVFTLTPNLFRDPSWSSLSKPGQWALIEAYFSIPSTVFWVAGQTETAMENSSWFPIKWPLCCGAWAGLYLFVPGSAHTRTLGNPGCKSTRYYY